MRIKIHRYIQWLIQGKQNMFSRYFKFLVVIVSLCVSFIPHTSLIAQDIHFSQFYAAPLHLSPSFSGSYLGTRLVSNYRIQWPEVPNAFTTAAISIDQSFPEFRSGVGLLVIRDTKGELDIYSNSLAINYSYDVKIKGDYHFRPGIAFSYCFSGIDASNALTRDMIQTGLPTSTQTISRPKANYFDAAFSGLFYNKYIWIGATCYHLTTPNVTFGSEGELPMEFSVFSGVKLGRKGKLIKPPKDNLTFAFQFMKLAAFNQLNIGCIGTKEFIKLGIWYRGIPAFKENPGSDAVIFSLGYEKNQFSIGISHDFTISGLSNYTNGANEIYLAYTIPYSKPKKKYTSLPCPVF